MTATDNLFARAMAPPDAETAFSDHAVIAAMLRFECALARGQERLGLIPAGIAGIIERHAQTLALDPATLVRETQTAGTLAIPLVHRLSAAVQSDSPDAARHVHFGATSQDVIDTALSSCTRVAVAKLDTAVGNAIVAATTLARRHAADPILARTLLQAAGITTFGWKFAHAALALARCRDRVRATARVSIAVSLGGPTGSLSAFGRQGPALRAAVAHDLGLADPGASWHSHRDQWLALATDTALLVGIAAKIAGDIALMAQNDVGSVTLAAIDAGGGSSAMPHKHNPVSAMRVLTAAQPVPGIVASLLGGMRQAHERALGEWQSGLALWPLLFDRAIDATTALATLLGELHADTARDRANIDAQLGVLFSPALAARFSPALGRHEAHALVATMCATATREHRQLLDVALAARRDDQRLAAIPVDGIEAVFDIDAAAITSVLEVDEMLALISNGVRPAPDNA